MVEHEPVKEEKGFPPSTTPKKPLKPEKIDDGFPPPKRPMPPPPPDKE